MLVITLPKKTPKHIAFITILLSSLYITACGGSSDGNDNKPKGSQPIPAQPVFGQQGNTSCFYEQTNEVDLACYLVPGSEGDTPTAYYASFRRNAGKFTATDNIATYNWSGITTSTAQYEAEGDVFHYEWNDTADESTQVESKGQPEESTLTRPLTPVIDAEETVTNQDPDGTLSGKMMVFEPSTRIINVPGSQRAIKAYNAIMLVQKIEILPNGSGLVSIEYYVPEVGVVAAVKYMNCPNLDSLNFVDDANYYEGLCASTNDRALIIQKDGPNSSNNSGGSTGSGQQNTGIATTFSNLLGAGNYQLHIGISRAGGLDPINELASNVACPPARKPCVTNLKVKQ